MNTRIHISFLIKNSQEFIRKLIVYLKREEVFLILDSNHYPVHRFRFVAAWGVHDDFFSLSDTVFQELKTFHQQRKDWLFGHISYDTKNLIEELESKHLDYIQFPLVYFFQPQIVLNVFDDKVEYYSLTDYKTIKQIHETIESQIVEQETFNPIVFKKRISKSDYVDAVSAIKKHIQLGDVYELNYCQEFYATDVKLNPYVVFLHMKTTSPMPFSAFYRLNDKYLMCASPERYLRKTGKTIISQPIKGTIKRGKTVEEDEQLYQKLASSAKDRSENIMIVDLVRNDLSRTASSQSVTVSELCKIYAYPTVFQMISTIQSTLHHSYSFADVIKTTFPMGSMTGAPKISAMQLIEQYEKTRRGLYSGTVGYISPEADFDFNVVIRSLQYNKQNRYASFITGGAITIQSVIEDEYQECFVKAQALLSTLNAVIDGE